MIGCDLLAQATGSITTSWSSIKTTLTEQVEVSILLGGGLSLAGFLRVYVTNGSLLNAFAISLSLLSIVVASVLLGSGLPFVLARAGVDPANAGTSIQVLMDILGVVITCATCQAVLVQFAGGIAG
jgi:Mg/Co/Ni transporter MgtE